MPLDEQSPDVDGDDGFPAVVQGFEVDAFEEWASWDRLRRLISGGHGAYGIAGPRGAGKTWLIRRATEYASEEEGVGLWFPSPSEYDSVAFLAAVTERLAEAVEERRQERLPILGFATLGPGFGAIGMFVFAVAGAYYWSLVVSQSLSGILLGAFVGLVFFALYFGFLRVIRAGSKGGRVLLYARDVKQRVRYALIRREGVDLGASVGSGLTAKLGMSRQMELTERPVTLSSLIHDFRRLAQLAADAVPGPVVIGIDELDKIDDDKEVRKLLRDIKGIFGIENVHFLVSVSYEAARALNLNGIVDRNEFNSSFDVVLELERVSVPVLTELLIARGWSGQREPAAEAIAVLSGGIPREAVRLAELVTSQNDVAALSNAEVVAIALAPEALEFRRVVVTAGPGENGARIGQEARTKTFSALSDSFLTMQGLSDSGIRFVEGSWNPFWAGDEVWVSRFQEEWRRLLVRIYVATLLIEGRWDKAEDLQRVVYVSTQSATVAMLTLLDALDVRKQYAEFVV